MVHVWTWQVCKRNSCNSEKIKQKETRWNKYFTSTPCSVFFVVFLWVIASNSKSVSASHAFSGDLNFQFFSESRGPYDCTVDCTLHATGFAQSILKAINQVSMRIHDNIWKPYDLGLQCLQQVQRSIKWVCKFYASHPPTHRKCSVVSNACASLNASQPQPTASAA